MPANLVDQINEDDFYSLMAFLLSKRDVAAALRRGRIDRSRIGCGAYLADVQKCVKCNVNSGREGFDYDDQQIVDVAVIPVSPELGSPLHDF